MTLFQSWGSLGSDYPGVGGGAPIFSYIFRFGALFLVQNFRKVKVTEWVYFLLAASFQIFLGILDIPDFFFFFFFFLGGGGGWGFGVNSRCCVQAYV